MALVTLQQISLSHGGPNLLDEVSLTVEPGDRLCLVGRNGVGKSTLLRIIAGEETPDSGTVATADGANPVYLPQEPTGQDLPDRSDLDVQKYLTRLDMPVDHESETMSGGELRRTLLAATLAAHSDVLLLDEPTNHLDIETVQWLEEHLQSPLFRGRGVVFVSHDRAFAARVANRIGELDRGTLRVYNEDYDTYIERRNHRLQAEEKQQREFDKKLAQEEAWLRKGTRARRTRDEGRVKALLAMRKDFRERRNRIGSARLGIAEGNRSGDIVLDTEDLAFRWDNSTSPLFADLTTTIFRGDRIGIVGPNGAGKTTLVRLLLGDLDDGVRTGSLRRGANLETVYFDQLREQVDPTATLSHAIGDGYDTVTVGTTRRNVTAYLKDFLFSEADFNRPTHTLSGGERNRLLLARLFASPSNVLVLDEPTNDLDMDTLELLEDRLSDYSGTIILISHDRRFLDNLVGGCLVLPGDGTVQQYAGGYSDWKDQYESYLSGRAPASVTPSGSTSTSASEKKAGQPSAPRPKTRQRKLSFAEQRELEGLPDRLETLEAEREEIHDLLANPDLYRQTASATPQGDSLDTRDPGELTRRLAQLDEEIGAAMRRWETLEEIAAADSTYDTSG
jgi:ATP-binding cassette subfamily F protein uup